MQPSFRIYQLTSGEVQRLRALNAMFGKAFEDPQTYGAEPPSDGYLQSLLVKEHVLVLVALINEQVVGGLVAYELDKFERARSEIYIYDLAVAEPYRRRGIASALIDHLKVIALQRGAWVIYVQADYADHPAIALYTKLGAREDVMHFDIAIAGRRHSN